MKKAKCTIHMRRFVKSFLLGVIFIVLFAILWLYQYQATHDIGSVTVVMCPACKEAFVAELGGSTKAKCAIYDIGTEVGQALASVDADVLTDDETKPAYGTPYVHAGLMHHKFCVINESIVVTGSYNPTDKGELSRNNLVIVHSKVLAKNYLAEFDSMKTKSVRPSIENILWVNDTRLENYFCPSDHCEEHVLAALDKAQTSIVFMTFSFTSDPIGKLLLDKQKQGVQVKGICDHQQIDQYSECPLLDAKNYSGSGILHHKVFIIDNETVITGSYNPTASGDRRNNENVLIIQDKAIAQQFLDEYSSVSQIT